MKFIVLGLCLTIIPAFATTSSCPQTQYSSLVGCQAFDSLLASTSDSSVVTSVDDPTNFAASLLAPAPTVQPLPVVPPSSSLSTSTNPLSLLNNAYTITNISPAALISPSPSPQVSVASSSTSLANQLLLDQVSLSSLVFPTVYLNVSQGLTPSPNSFDFAGPFSADPGVPETGSIAMIGSGLIFLSLVSMMGRKRNRLGNS